MFFEIKMISGVYAGVIIYIHIYLQKPSETSKLSRDRLPGSDNRFRKRAQQGTRARTAEKRVEDNVTT